MHLDPIKPTLRAPGIKRLKLKCEVPLSNFAFKFNLRRHDKGGDAAAMTNRFMYKAFAMVGRCRLTL